MDFIAFAHRTKLLLNHNSSVILTGVGVVGTVGTAFLTGRASLKAARMIDFAQKEIEKDRQLTVVNGTDEVVYDQDTAIVKLSRVDVVKLVWKPYVPAVGAGVVTVASIIVAHRVDAKKIMALTVASGISERALKEYKEKVIEKLGPSQESKIHDQIAQDRVDKNPITTSEIIVAGDGKVLCMDMLTGRYFMSTAEDIKRAENTINRELNQVGDASLSKFFDEIGLLPTTYSDTVGWDGNHPLEVVLSSAVSLDQRPCLTVDYNPHPFPDYWRAKY